MFALSERDSAKRASFTAGAALAVIFERFVPALSAPSYPSPLGALGSTPLRFYRESISRDLLLCAAAYLPACSRCQRWTGPVDCRLKTRTLTGCRGVRRRIDRGRVSSGAFASRRGGTAIELHGCRRVASQRPREIMRARWRAHHHNTAVIPE